MQSMFRYTLIIISLLGLPMASMAAETIEYVHTDSLGSVVAVSNEAGQVIERRSYEPFGAQAVPSQSDGPA